MQTEVNLICSYEQGNCGSVSEGMYVWKRKRGKAEAGSRDGARGHSQHQEKKSMINTHTHTHTSDWMDGVETTHQRRIQLRLESVGGGI